VIAPSSIHGIAPSRLDIFEVPALLQNGLEGG